MNEKNIENQKYFVDFTDEICGFVRKLNFSINIQKYF